MKKTAKLILWSFLIKDDHRNSAVKAPHSFLNETTLPFRPLLSSAVHAEAGQILHCRFLRIHYPYRGLESKFPSRSPSSVPLFTDEKRGWEVKHCSEGERRARTQVAVCQFGNRLAHPSFFFCLHRFQFSCHLLLEEPFSLYAAFSLLWRYTSETLLSYSLAFFHILCTD